MRRSLDDEIKEIDNKKSKDQDPTSDQTKEIYKQIENKLPVNI